eukprot:symbB.v1.2.035228.t1/scaffold4696.1/size81176/2
MDPLIVQKLKPKWKGRCHEWCHQCRLCKGRRHQDNRESARLCGDTLPQTLGEFCQSVGEVRYATVYMDPDSGSSNGTGKVDFDCQETAERAIRDLNGSTLDGVQITVQSLADVPLHYWQRRDTGRAIFVGNLDPSVTKDELQAFASRVGEVVFTRIFTDRQTGHSRGCGKVEYASVEQAEEAINKLNGKALGGQAVTVEPMASERRPPVPKPQSTVFVGGLAPEMDEGALLELASRIGPVSFARIFRDRDSGRSRNCGKIEFETEDLALQALTQLAGVDFHGRKISVQPFGQASENPELRRPQARRVFDNVAAFIASTDRLCPGGWAASFLCWSYSRYQLRYAARILPNDCRSCGHGARVYQSRDRRVKKNRKSGV